MSPKKVLLISYYFPPLGGVGISRPLALFQNLPAHDYDCHVLTVKPVLYRAYESELLNEIDNSKIFRSGSRDPSRLLYLLGVRHLKAKIADDSRNITKHFFPDAKAGWIKPAIRLGQKMMREHKYDLIISTSPPISAHVIAKELSRVSGIPWVADFRDYWVSLKAEDFFSSENDRANASRLLNEIKSSANAIVAVNESVGNYVGAKSVIPNCYDSQLARLWRIPEDKSQFTIGVFGTIGELTPIEPLLKVMQLLKQLRPDLYLKIRILQVGQVDMIRLKRQIAEYGLQGIFEIKQYQKRKKAIEFLSDAAMFYIGVSLNKGKGLSTNRIFTLLSSGRPILAYAGSGSELDRIISPYHKSQRFDDGSIREAANFLLRMAEEFLSGNSSFKIEPDYAKEFSDDKMVEKFVSVFEQILLTN